MLLLPHYYCKYKNSELEFFVLCPFLRKCSYCRPRWISVARTPPPKLSYFWQHIWGQRLFSVLDPLFIVCCIFRSQTSMCACVCVFLSVRSSNQKTEEKRAGSGSNNWGSVKDEVRWVLESRHTACSSRHFCPQDIDAHLKCGLHRVALFCNSFNGVASGTYRDCGVAVQALREEKKDSS